MTKNYRRCLSCRKIAPKSEFWRVVRVYPAKNIDLDRGMGRSAYICPNFDCLQNAEKKNRLGKSLKANVPPDIYQTLRRRLSNSSDDLTKVDEDYS